MYTNASCTTQHFYNATPDTSCCSGGVDRGGGGAIVGNAKELNELVLIILFDLTLFILTASKVEVTSFVITPSSSNSSYFKRDNTNNCT